MTKEQGKILEIINDVSVRKAHRTYLEEIKVSHKEVVMADILAHFFKPKPTKPHFLNDIFIKALLKTESSQLDNKSKNGLIHENLDRISNSCFLDAKVDVEKTTDKKKRLDIIITSKKANTVIGIEFKINHDLDNPLNEYQGLIDGRKYKDYSNKIYIVLTPYWKEPIGAAKDNSVFVQVMLSHFIEEIEKEVKERNVFDERKNTLEYFYYIDFINTIKNKGAKIQVVKDYKALITEEKIKKEEIFKLEISENFDKDSIVLKTIKAFYESKIKALKKELDKDSKFEFVKLLNQNVSRVVQVLEFKKEKQIYKVRLSIKGWSLEKWAENGQSETKCFIEDIFSSISSIKAEIEKYVNGKP